MVIHSQTERKTDKETISLKIKMISAKEDEMCSCECSSLNEIGRCQNYVRRDLHFTKF